MFYENFGYIFSFIIMLIFLFLFILFKRKRRGQVEVSLNKMIESSGYAYDPSQDIFYSRIDAWQRNFGYCQLYDEVAPSLSLIFDCEPIEFEYGNKRWMIELWKGQYGMTTGCEIGVYNTDRPDLNIPGIFNGTFYDCADDEDHLYLTFVLRKNQEFLFKRNDKHWWLTGFILGEFSEPCELTMEAAITLKDKLMLDAFVDALMQKGYSYRNMRVVHTTVWILFDRPYSKQPYMRLQGIDRIYQNNNRMLCETFQELTKDYATAPEKIRVLKEKSPKLFDMVVNMGRPIHLYKDFDQIKRFFR